jgi:hypothetical protein
MRFLKVWMVLFAFSSTALAASIDGVYVGTLGKSEILLKLMTEKNAGISGSYYYRNYAIDIRLEGKINKSSITLSEFGAGSTDPTASVSLNSAGNVLSGRWASVKQPKRFLAINLRRVTSKDLSKLKLPSTTMLNKWKLEQPYDYLRFNAPLKPVKTETINGKKVQWWLEPKSKIVFLRLEGESKTVNNALTDEHYRIAYNNLDCLSSFNGDFSYTPTVALYSKRILSISASVYYYCGGAHPDGGSENLNLDLETGKELQLEDVYRFIPIPEGLKIDPSDYSESYSKYREARGAAVKKLILNQFGGFTKGIDQECSNAYSDETFSYFSWYLNAKGLVIESAFPHVAAACDNDFELPYKTLETQLAPNSPLK